MPLQTDDFEEIDGDVRVSLDKPLQSLGRGKIESVELGTGLRLMRADLVGQPAYNGEVLGCSGLILEIRLSGLSKSIELGGRQRTGHLEAGLIEVAGCPQPATWRVSAPAQSEFRTVAIGFSPDELMRLKMIDSRLCNQAMHLLVNSKMIGGSAPLALIAVAEMLLLLDIDAPGGHLKAAGYAMNCLADALGIFYEAPAQDNFSMLARRVAASLQANPHPGRTLRILAHEFLVSEASLKRIFMAHHGVSIGKFAKTARLSLARQMMISGSSVAAAAEMLGYSSPETFCRAYKQHYGMSPRASKPT
ncbi:helix-turn-helix transcriptional regulator [Pseudaestuariivita rosea]|uniref:helix-turn-helix transcriptional regulator n=1 Tax=Pseudaestuariivita rosea TaxID=2763263 RepID=UPI001ABA8CD0|nr:AraC family transcriptional regulator [Pseudaestuariivita rosea]